MKRFQIEQSDEEFYTSHSGISLVGLALNRFTSITAGLEKVAPSDDVISHADAIKSYCGLLAQAKSDFVAIEQFRADDFFRESLGNRHIPSEGNMREPSSRCSPGLPSSFCGKLKRRLPPSRPAMSPWTSTALPWITPIARRRRCPIPIGSLTD